MEHMFRHMRSALSDALSEFARNFGISDAHMSRVRYRCEKKFTDALYSVSTIADDMFLRAGGKGGELEADACERLEQHMKQFIDARFSHLMVALDHADIFDSMGALAPGTL